MKLTLLLDLDGTLLDSDMDKFISVYFHKLGNALGEYVAPKRMLKFLMQGTQAMIENDSPTVTLEEVFSREFYPNLGVEREVLDSAIADFYENIFPTLAPLTKACPEAVDFVEWAFAQGHTVVISTNPLFPKSAIYHRLRWAGLEPERYPFDIISSFETFHFSKPNPAYLAEVLSRIGWEDNPILVVGDDPVRDLQGAQGLGLPAYWIADEGDVLPEGTNPPLGRGNVGALRGWIEAHGAEAFTPDYQAKNAVVATLKAVPAALAVMLSNLPAETESSRPKAEALRSMLISLGRIEREDNLPKIEGFLQEGFSLAEVVEGADVFQAFISARLLTLRALEKLSDAGWQRRGEELALMAEQDRVYLRRIYKRLGG